MSFTKTELSESLHYNAKIVKKTKWLTGHDLEAIEAAALVISDGLVGHLLLLGAPALNVVQDVDSGRALRLDSAVLIVAKDGLVHGDEIDDGDR